MRYSHSRVETFAKCPYLYKLRYLDELKTIKDVDDANNPLYIGSGIHTAIEQNVKAGIKAYFAEYPVISDLHINEAIKFEYLAPKVNELFKQDEVTFEYKLEYYDFLGFIDALVSLGNDEYAIYDFKYSNNIERYCDSPQLHIYKEYFERLNPGKRVVKLGYIFIPKVMIRQKKTESLGEFRLRLIEQLKHSEVRKIEVDFDQAKVRSYFNSINTIEGTKEFGKNESKLCDWCEFKLYCQEGLDFMILPPSSRRAVTPAARKKVWIYGAPFCGKTTLANQFPTPIMLNTDGNLNSFDAPFIEIKDVLNGRIKTLGWDVFKDAVSTLQAGNHEFKTIVVDLVEDAFEYCRRWCYSELNIEHESDNSFKAWDYVRGEFLATMKTLMTLPYNIVLISHEDTSKDITSKSGDKITSIAPNIQGKIANKLAGMVDIVARVIADDKKRTLNFKADEVVFGGGRLKLSSTKIPCSYAALESLYEEQNAGQNVIQSVEVNAAPIQPVVNIQEPNPYAGNAVSAVTVETKPAAIETQEMITTPEQFMGQFTQALQQENLKTAQETAELNQKIQEINDNIDAIAKASAEIKAQHEQGTPAAQDNAAESETSTRRARRSRSQFSELSWEPESEDELHAAQQNVERTRRTRRSRTAAPAVPQTDSVPF